MKIFNDGFNKIGNKKDRQVRARRMGWCNESHLKKSWCLEPIKYSRILTQTWKIQSHKDRFKDVKGNSVIWINGRSAKDFKTQKNTHWIAISDRTNIHIQDNCKIKLCKNDIFLKFIDCFLNVVLIKPFPATGLFLYPLKTTEFFWCFQGVQKETSSMIINTERDHLFSTFSKFSEKLTFLTPWYAHVRERTRE